MVKNFETMGENEKISAEDLELINRQSMKKLTADEVFTFSVVLCDNEIDRDFEVFTDDALSALEKLFVGKTGILNHSYRSEDQLCRTYKTQLLTDSSKKTGYGDTYKYLKAWCYTVKSKKNEDFIRDIESGIKKEVSISCNFAEKVCSVCGENVCNHKAGKYYGDVLCYKKIEGITDAYEWSFVAVPAQRNAGVTKSAKKTNRDTEHLNKARSEKELNLARQYRAELINNVKKGFSMLFPELSAKSADRIIEMCDAELLSEINAAFSKKTAKNYPVKSQFQTVETVKNDNNSQFKF